MNPNYEAKPSTIVDGSPILAGAWDVIFHLRELIQTGEMIVELEMFFTERLDDSLLNRAVELLFESEPILRYRLVIEAQPRPEWQLIPGFQHQPLLVAHDAAEYEAFRHSGLSSVAGPQAGVCLCHDDDVDRLIIKVTHAVTDAAGLKTLGSHLASFYTALAADPGFRPMVNPPRRRGPDQVLERASTVARAKVPFQLLKTLIAMRSPNQSVRLIQPASLADPWSYVLREIEPPRISRVADYGRARGATLNDLFLTAMYRALAGEPRTPNDRLRIFMTIDLRQWFMDPAESGSVCNLSSFDLPFLQRDLGANFDETLQRVVRLTAETKRTRSPLAPAAMAHWLRPRRPLTGTTLDWALKMVEEKHYIPAFTNTGRLDPTALTFGGAIPQSAHINPPKVNAPGLLLCMSGYRGSITLSSGNPLSGRDTIASFIERVVDALPA